MGTQLRRCEELNSTDSVVLTNGAEDVSAQKESRHYICLFQGRETKQKNKNPRKPGPHKELETFLLVGSDCDLWSVLSLSSWPRRLFQVRLVLVGMLVLLLRCLTLPAASSSCPVVRAAASPGSPGSGGRSSLPSATGGNHGNHCTCCCPLLGNHEAPLWFQAIRTFNSILESLSRQQRRLIQNDQNQNLTQLAAAVVMVGDYEFQVSLLEALCRLTPRREREQRANQWFDSSDIRSAFCDIRDADFEVDCRRFLNFVNRYHGDQRRVYTFPCLKAFLSSTQLFRPKDEKLDKFWIDFNVGSGCVSFFIDDPQGFLWASIHLQMEDVNDYSLKLKQNETVLCVRLTNPIMHLNTRSHVVELTFDPEHQQELEEAAGRVFNKQVSPSGARGAVRTSPSADTARSYSRKKPPSKSQLKILPLSSPSSEDESTSLKRTASNRAEVLFDQIVHSTPKFSAAFQPLLDPPDGADGSEAHLSSLEEPPSGDLQGAELQTTQHLTEGLEQGSSSPSNKENLRKREASDSGYLSDQAEGVAPSKRKAEPLQDWAESELPMKEGAELAEEEALQSEGPKQKAEPESHLTSDITAAFKSFKAQLEQRFTGCWQEVQAEVLRSLRDCQQHVSSLLTAVHQHRLLLLQQFESSVTDHLKQLEENSTMDSEILTFFHSEMEQLRSFCQEHLKKLKTLDSDQLRSAHSSNH
uniref:Synaptonemal complex protein 2-like n=1 Tax=Poecilia reticulata TaxID=8081 RepID=A0A3P9P0K6_POERE